MHLGRLTPDQQECFQRGLAYGDGLFETMRVADGRVPLIAEHEVRLNKGMTALQLQVDMPRLLDQLEQQAVALGDGLLKLVLVRRSSGRGYAPATRDACYFLEAHSLPPSKDQGQGIRTGIARLRLSRQPRLAGIKHLNRLEQVLAARETTERGLDELWLCDDRGRLVEGVQSNLFILGKSGWQTPVLDQAGVAGVVRAWVLRQMEALSLPCTVCAFPAVHLDTIQAAFMTSSGQGIMGVSHIDDQVLDPHHEVIWALKQAWKRMLESGSRQPG